MIRSWLCLLWLLAPTVWAQGQPATPSPELSQLVDRLTVQHQSRYLVKGATCQNVDVKTWPGYEALPTGSLRQCRYTVSSCQGLSGAEKTTCLQNRKVATPKSATVVLYDPGPERLARWILNACAQAGGNQTKCIEELYQEGQIASTWQIPIAGLVFEDMPWRYVHYAYAFRDGLTVRADAPCSWENGHPDGERTPTPAEERACSSPQTAVLSVSDKIRPLSTTRAELIGWKPELLGVLPVGEAVGTNNWHFEEQEQAQWRDWVRKTLIEAASAGSNPFFLAKAAALRRQGKF